MKAKLCIARLVKIQGHTGIAGNEHADLEAKMEAMSIVNSVVTVSETDTT